MIGGYAYFNDEDELVCVNALSVLETDYSFPLSGPFQTTKQACRDLCRLKLVHPISLKAFHEKIVAMASILPNGKFDGQSVTDGRQCIHGGFTFFWDNGTSVTYAIEEIGTFVSDN